MDKQSTEPIANVKAEGWDWFEKQSGEAKTIIEQRMGMTPADVASHFKKCFGTKSGKIVLEYLDVFCNDVRDFDPSLGFYNGAAFGFWRSGQKSFMAVIKAFMRTKTN